MAEFFAAVGEKYDKAGIAADSIYNSTVRYYVAKVIDDYGGAGILSHKMTHNVDNSVFLDGYQRRPGAGVELYADGLLQSAWNPTPGNYVLNTVLTFDTNYRTTNKGPERFQNREDLQEYMHGLFDVTYLLDYAEAQAMINKSASEKQLMYAQISYDSSKKADVVSGPISKAVADKLNTIDDFIDNNIVARRGYKPGNYNSILTSRSLYMRQIMRVCKVPILFQAESFSVKLPLNYLRLKDGKMDSLAILVISMLRMPKKTRSH